MSWDIVVFSAARKINTIEEVAEDLLVPVDFQAMLKTHFRNWSQDGNFIRIEGPDFSITCFEDEEPVSNKMFSLYGEHALYEMVNMARANGLCIYDTSLDAFIDLDYPGINGYENFQQYLQHVIDNKDHTA